MTIDDHQKSFFDENAEIWDIISIHDLTVVRHVTELLDLKGDERILDVGTGTGVMIPFYEKYAPEGKVTAIDYSENMIEVARRKFPAEDHPNVEFRVCDLYEFTSEDMFDVINCYSCFPHFNDKPGAVSHLLSLLRPGGTFMISHGCSRAHINHVHEEGGKLIRHDVLPDMESMISMFENAGLEVTYTEDNESTFIIIGRKADCFKRTNRC